MSTTADMLGSTCLTVAKNYVLRSCLMEAAIGTPLLCASTGLEVTGMDCMCRVHGPPSRNRHGILEPSDEVIGGYTGDVIGLSQEQACNQVKLIREKMSKGLELLPMTGEDASAVMQALRSLMRTAGEDWYAARNGKKNASDYRLRMAMQAANLAWQIIKSLPTE
eukprot:1714792-Rhodomonas_salina.1